MVRLTDNQEKKVNIMIWIIGLLFTGLTGFQITQAVTFGAVRQQQETDHELLEFVSRDYSPAWYNENMIKLMTIHTDRVVAAIKENNEEVARLNKEFESTMKVLNDNFIMSRGGMRTDTRGLVKP